MGKIKLFQEFISINETSFSRVARIMKGDVESVDSVGIITAENPMGENKPKDYNAYVQSELKNILIENNYGFHEVMGKYGNIENSLIIPNIGRNFMIHLCEMFNQESIIWGEKIEEEKMRFYYIEQDGTVVETIDEVFVGSDAQSRKDFFTWVQNRKFYIPFFQEKSKPKEHKRFFKPNVYQRTEKYKRPFFDYDDEF
jgi:Protein of unknown function (DUF3293)